MAIEVIKSDIESKTEQIFAGRPPKEIISELVQLSDERLAELWRDPDSFNRESGSGKEGFQLERTLSNPLIQVDARVLEVNDYGHYIHKHYDKSSLYQRLESARPLAHPPAALKPLPLRESISLAMRENSVGETPGFSPYFTGPYHRQQYMFKMLEGKAKSFDAFIHNPLGRRIPQIVTQFTMGKGVVAEFVDPQAQQLWDQFAAFNKIGTSRGGISRGASKLRTWCMMQSVDGESMFQFVDTPQMLKVKSLDTATILDVISDPEDVDNIFYYHQQYMGPYNMYPAPNVPMTLYVIRQLPANEVEHIKLNCFDNEKRGRGDMYNVVGWMKRLKELITAEVVKAYFHACFTWDYSVEGSPSEVNRLIKDMRAQKSPAPGSSYIHSKNITRTMVSPSGTAGATVQHDLQGLLNMISLGTGIPPAYLLSSFAGSRAAALTETEPATKMFLERQAIWDETLHSFSDRLFQWAGRRGMQFQSTECEFSFPSVTPIGRAEIVSIIPVLKQEKIFSPKRLANMVAKEFSVSSYDHKTEQDAILEQTREAIDYEFEENKYRTVAETKLQIWQSYYAQAAAQEEMRIGGPAATGQQPQAAPPGGPEPDAPAAVPGEQPISGGLTDEHRANLAKGGR